MADYAVDVAIVGAGPAGSVAAWELAKRNVSVLVLEKRQEIGAPKRCAEGINIKGLRNIGIEPDPKWAMQEIVGVILYSPKMREVDMSVGNNTGYILERKMFEKWLATQAIKAGARYMVKTTVTDVITDGGRVVGLKADHMGEPIIVRSKLVIAADGVDSMTAKRAGIDTVNKLADYHSGFQYEMAGVQATENKLHLFFGNEIAPKGYIWIFPKGDTVANVGIGIVGAKSEEGRRAKDLLDKFIRNNPRFFAKASPIEVNGGGIPVAIQVKTFVGDGIMVVGDAAHQVNPIHGGGIAISTGAAKIAAKVAADALADGDTSRKRLLEYEKAWYEADGSRVKTLLKLRMFVEKLSDEELESLADILTPEELMALTTGDNKIMLKAMFTKASKLLPLAKKYLE
ncbi:MAG: NAD(P)/FAD-dependent oxidoreductase [Candidatus Altiarchaeota archaeon]